MRTFEFRLIGHASPDGEVILSDLLALGGPLKDLFYRLTRGEAGTSGPGRADAVIESLSRARLALAPGSTRLILHVGDDSALVDPIADAVDDAFWQLVDGVERNTRPEGVTDTIAASVDALVAGMMKTAPRIEVSVPGRGVRELSTSQISRAPWQHRATGEGQEATLHGRLEMVDLRSAQFRIVDTVGNRIELVQVRGAADAAHLVNQHVSVRGRLRRGVSGQRPRLEGVEVMASEGAAARLGVDSIASPKDLAAESRLLPPMTDRLDLSQKELEDYLAAVRA